MGECGQSTLEPQTETRTTTQPASVRAQPTVFQVEIEGVRRRPVLQAHVPANIDADRAVDVHFLSDNHPRHDNLPSN
jgi:hypothetical protein